MGPSLAARVWASALLVRGERVADLLADGAIRAPAATSSSGSWPGGGADAVELASEEAAAGWVETVRRRRDDDAASRDGAQGGGTDLVVRLWCEVGPSGAAVRAETTRAAVTLVDVAGSAGSGHPGRKSLSGLADVLAARRAGAPHTPFRNSALTQILREELSGGAALALLLGVSADPARADDAVSAMRFAASCRATALGRAPRHVVEPAP